jgi:hypothetical protein
MMQGSNYSVFIRHYRSDETLEGVCDTAPARSVIKAKLVYEWYDRAVEKAFDFILMNYNDSWNPEVRGTPGSNWFVYNWDWYA